MPIEVSQIPIPGESELKKTIACPYLIPHHFIGNLGLLRGTEQANEKGEGLLSLFTDPSNPDYKQAHKGIYTTPKRKAIKAILGIHDVTQKTYEADFLGGNNISDCVPQYTANSQRFAEDASEKGVVIGLVNPSDETCSFVQKFGVGDHCRANLIQVLYGIEKGDPFQGFDLMYMYSAWSLIQLFNFVGKDCNVNEHQPPTIQEFFKERLPLVLHFADLLNKNLISLIDNSIEIGSKRYDLPALYIHPEALKPEIAGITLDSVKLALLDMFLPSNLFFALKHGKTNEEYTAFVEGLPKAFIKSIKGNS